MPPMIPLPREEELPTKVRDALAKLPPLNVFRAVANVPRSFGPFFALGASLLTDSQFDARTREIAILRVATITNSPYEWRQHVQLARNLGVSESEITAIGSEDPAAVLDDAGALACRVADEISREVRLSDDALAQLLERHGPRGAATLILCVSYYNMVSRFLESTRVELESDELLSGYTPDSMARSGVRRDAAGTAVVLDDRTTIEPALHHVNLKTTRLDQLVDWYAVVVGMRPNFRNGGIAFLTNDAANHRLALGRLPFVEVDADKLRHDGMHHIAFEYRTLDELLGTYVRLKREGITPHMCLDHGLTMSFYYVDPDGNSVELQSDNYGDWARSTEYLRNDPGFAQNPIGVFVDPEALVYARRAGADPGELHDRALGGEFPPPVPPDLRLPELGGRDGVDDV